MGKRLGCFGIVVIIMIIVLVGNVFREKAQYESYSKMMDVMESYQPIAEFVIHMQRDLIPQIVKYKLDLNAPAFAEIEKVKEMRSRCIELYKKTDQIEVDSRFIGIQGAMLGVLNTTQYYLGQSLVREGVIEEYWPMESYYNDIQYEYETFFSYWSDEEEAKVDNIPRYLITKIYGEDLYKTTLQKSLPDIPDFQIPYKWRQDYSRHVR